MIPNDQAFSCDDYTQLTNSGQVPQCYPEEIHCISKMEIQSYLALLDNIPLIYFILDGIGNVLALNKYGAECLGYELEEVIATKIFALIHPQDRVILEDKLINKISVFSDGDTNNSDRLVSEFNTFNNKSLEWHELRLVCRNNNILWVKANGRVLLLSPIDLSEIINTGIDQNEIIRKKLARIYSGNGEKNNNQIAIFLVFCQNISDYKQELIAKREREKNYLNLIDISLEPIALYRGEKLLYINNAGVQLWRAKNAGELLNQNLFNLGLAKINITLENTVQIRQGKIRRLDGSIINTDIIETEITYNGKTAIQAIFRNIRELQPEEIIELNPTKQITEKLPDINLSPLAKEIINISLTGKNQNAQEEEVTSILCAIEDNIGDFQQYMYNNEKYQKEIAEKNCQQEAITKLGQRAISGIDLVTLMDEAVILVADTLKVDYCKILEFMPDKNKFILRSGVGWQEGIVGKAIISADITSQAGYTMLFNQPIIVENLTKETRFSGMKLLHEHGVISGVSVIITSKSLTELDLKQSYIQQEIELKIQELGIKIIPYSENWILKSKLSCFGILGVHTKKYRNFTHDDVYFLQSVANILATAIERKHTDARLHLLERAIASSNNGIIITDATIPYNPVIYVNNSFERLTGYSAAQVIGKNCRFLQGKNTEQTGLYELRRAIAEKRECHVIIQNYRQDGSSFWNELYIAPVLDEKGNLTNFIGIQTDISQRMAAEENLQQLYSAIEQTADSILITNEKGIIQYINPAFEKSTGYAAKEVIGKTPAILNSGKQDQIFYKNLWTTIERGNVFRGVFINRKKDGELFYEEKTITPIRDVSGQITHFISTAKDITDRKRSEVALRQQAEGERLIAAIGIRIRQSLNLAEILNTTVAEVRQFLETDRVLIYRFEPDGSGIIAVESVDDKWMAIQGTIVKDNCFAYNYMTLYQDGRVRAINDIYNNNLKQCHIDLLEPFEVKANLVVPILLNGEIGIHPEKLNIQGGKKDNCKPQLWGLLIAHHCQSARQWEQLEIDLLKQLANQVAIAIQQSALFEEIDRARTHLEREVNMRTAQLQQSLAFTAGVQRITDKVRESLDESQILQTAVNELANVLKVDYCGAALYNSERTNATIHYESTNDQLGTAIGQVIDIVDAPLVHSQLLSGITFAGYTPEQKIGLESKLVSQPDIKSTISYTSVGDLACPILFSQLAAKLLCPIFDDQEAIGYLLVINQTKRNYDEMEIRLVQQVANQCAIAIRQARLYQAAEKQVEELRKLSQLKDDFLSTVSHELRTPMANMKMAIQMLIITLNREQINPEKSSNNSHHKNNSFNPAIINNKSGERYLQILQSECEREISLINDLLDLQRLDSGTQPRIADMIQLKEWLFHITEPFIERASSRSQILQLEIPPNLPNLVCDPNSLSRILGELLNNACKYTPPHEKIIVKANIISAKKIQIQVINYGIEILPQEQTRIFEKFYRIPSADPWKQGGTGLGLALVQKLTQHLGGNISIDSKNKQTCFTIELPLTTANS